MMPAMRRFGVNAHLLDLAGGTSLGGDGDGRADGTRRDALRRHRDASGGGAAGGEDLRGAGGSDRGGGESAHDRIESRYRGRL